MARSAALQSPPRHTTGETQDPVVIVFAGAALDPRQSYSDQIEARLREAILAGTLPPGATLSEATVALAVGVSRQPVREALRRLESDTTDPEARRNAIRTSAEQKLKQLGETNK